MTSNDPNSPNAPAPAPHPGYNLVDEASPESGVLSFGLSEESKSESNPTEQVSSEPTMKLDDTSMKPEASPMPPGPRPSLYDQTYPPHDPFIMPKPIMGDYVDPFLKNCVVVGGQPNPLWTGLVDFPRDNPTCFRTLGYKSKDDGFVTRSTPPAHLKFTKKCNLFVALPKLILFAHLHGLDTILYVNNPKDRNEMLFIPTDHAHLKYDMVKREALFLMNNKWDRYDRQNNSAMVTLLLAACDKELEAIVMPLVLRESIPAAALLQKICSEVDFKNSLSWEHDRAKLMQLKLSDHPGMNVQKFCEKVGPLLTQLENANELTVPVMTWLLNAFIDTDIKNFSSPFYQKYFSTFIQVADRSGERTSSELMETLRAFNLHWSDILDYATNEYKTLLYANKWAAAMIPKDSGAVPSFNLTEFNSHPELKKKVVALLAAEAKHNKDKDTNKDKKPQRFLKDPAPKEGEKNYKLVKSFIYIFCPHCRQGKGSWQRTHTGAMHGQKQASLTEEQLTSFTKLAKEKKEIPELNFCIEVGTSGITL